MTGHDRAYRFPPSDATSSTAPSSLRQSLKPSGRSPALEPVELVRETVASRDENRPSLPGQRPVALLREPIVSTRMLRLQPEVERGAASQGDGLQGPDPSVAGVPERQRFLEHPSRGRRIADSALADRDARQAGRHPQIVGAKLLPGQVQMTSAFVQPARSSRRGSRTGVAMVSERLFESVVTEGAARS